MNIIKYDTLEAIFRKKQVKVDDLINLKNVKDRTLKEFVDDIKSKKYKSAFEIKVERNGLYFDKEEIIRIAQIIKEKLGLKELDLVRIYGMIIYMDYRFNFGKPREFAYKKAFPENCFTKRKGIIEELSEASIINRARQLENNEIFKLLYNMMSASMYIYFANERLELLKYVYDKAFDKKMSDRTRIEYIKVFLEETRKPDEFKNNLELNVNIEEINQVELNTINQLSQKLEGVDADSIIKLLESTKKEDKK